MWQSDRFCTVISVNVWEKRTCFKCGKSFNTYKWFDKWATTYSLSGQAKKQLPAWEKFQQSRRVWKPLPHTEKTLYECPRHFIQKQTVLFWNTGMKAVKIYKQEMKPSSFHMLNRSVVIFCRSPEWVESWEQHANEQTKSEYLSRCASDSKMLKCTQNRNL